VSAVSLEGLTKVYATGVKAVDALDLNVEKGEFVVLVGPSGCGKTTALRMVAGLEGITSGTLRFGDRVVNDVSPRHRDVAMVFQNYALYPHLTVAQNIGFSLENKKVPRPERDRRVRDAAGILGLSDLLKRTPRQLSGGQRQRVAMGRAIVREPAVFLMDEPLSNLDARLRVQMRAEVLRVHRRINATTLYVTHDQTEAMTMGDRVAVLRSGQLQQYGSPRDLYDHPANLFVASFIGSPAINLFEAALEESGDGTVLVLGSQRITLRAGGGTRGGPASGGPASGAPASGGPMNEGPASGAPASGGLAAYHGRKVVVGIRPEGLGDPAVGGGSRVGGTSAGGHASHAHATRAADTRLVEMLGSEKHVFFSIDATPVRAEGVAVEAANEDTATNGILAGAAPNGVARLDPRSSIDAGTRVRFTVDTERLHFFDADTHQAIQTTAC
jgi:multiple sugar transport system ATP-binding protein